MATAVPLLHLPARRAQHPLADRHDQARRFGDRDELLWIEQAELGVLPPHQRLHRVHPLRVQVEDRLEVQHQLVGLHGTAQSGFQRQLLERTRVHGACVELERVAPLRLRAVHRDIGVLEQRLGVRPVIGIEADPQARGHEQLAAAHHHRALHRLAHLARDRDRVLHVVDLRGEQHELVAADARQRVVLAKQRRDALRDEAKQRVARAVAQRVVDHLEAVEIEEEHRELVTVAVRVGDRQVEPVQEELPVGQAGERVMIREMLDLRARVHAGLALVLEQPDNEAQRHRELQQEIDEAEVLDPGQALPTSEPHHRRREDVQLLETVSQECAADEPRAEPAADAARPDDRVRGEEEGDADQARAHGDPQDEPRIARPRIPRKERRGRDGEDDERHGRAGHERAGNGLRHRQLVDAEEEPRELHVAGDGGDDRGAEPRRMGGGIRRREADRDRAEEQVHAKREPAPRPVEQVALAVVSVEAEKHRRGEERAGGLHHERDVQNQRLLENRQARSVCREWAAADRGRAAPGGILQDDFDVEVATWMATFGDGQGELKS